MRLHISVILTLLVLFGVLGCRSVRSTVVNRQSDNSFTGNSNGELMKHDKTRPYTGVPIRIDVPSHLDVSISETYYLGRAASGGPVTEVTIPDVPRGLTVTTSLVVTPKIFMVDFVRPAGGTLTTSASFSGNQYFSEINNKIVDTTINQVTSAISTLAPLLGGKSVTFPNTKTASATVGSSISGNYVPVQRLVAFRRFDIDDPDFEQQLDAFVYLHLNACYRCEDYFKSGIPNPCPESHGQPGVQPCPETSAGMFVPPPSPVTSPVSRRKLEEGEPVLQTPHYKVYPVN